jgi:ABC-type transport system substrate-binding protein
VDHAISEVLEIARSDPNGVRRAEMYRSYQQWFLERAAAIPLYNPLYHYAVSCQVDGVQLAILAGPSDRFRNLHEWRILSPDAAAGVCP